MYKTNPLWWKSGDGGGSTQMICAQESWERLRCVRLLQQRRSVCAQPAQNPQITAPGGVCIAAWAVPWLLWAVVSVMGRLLGVSDRPPGGYPTSVVRLAVKVHIPSCVLVSSMHKYVFPPITPLRRPAFPALLSSSDGIASLPWDLYYSRKIDTESHAR